jgi:hypothetical protein
MDHLTQQTSCNTALKSLARERGQEEEEEEGVKSGGMHV